MIRLIDRAIAAPIRWVAYFTLFVVLVMFPVGFVVTLIIEATN